MPKERSNDESNEAKHRMGTMTIVELKPVDTSRYPPSLAALVPEAFTQSPPTSKPAKPEESILGLLIASCFAGGVKGSNFEHEARSTLREGNDEELRRSAWSQIIPCLRAHEWLALIRDEGLTWGRAAQILRAMDLDFGWLTGPVNDHRDEHVTGSAARTHR